MTMVFVGLKSVKYSKAVLNSGFPFNGTRISDSLLVELGSWIPLVSKVLGYLSSRVPDSKT